MTSDDKLPNKICGECKQQITTFYTFKQKTKRTEESLCSMLELDPLESQQISSDEPIVCATCDIMFKDETAFLEHAQTEHQDLYDIDGIQIKTMESDEKDNEIELIEFGMINDDNSTDDLITSDTIEEDTLVTEEIATRRVLRSRETKTKSLVKDTAAKSVRSNKRASKSKQLSEMKHTSFENVEIADEYSDRNIDFEQDTSESDAFECPICLTQFMDRDEYLKHCREHDGIEFQCAGCNELFANEDLLLQHDCEVMENLSEEDLSCKPCMKKMKSRAQLRQHSKMHDSMNLIINYVDFFPCHDCCLLFITREKLNEHNIEIHSDKMAKESDETSDGEPFKKIDESCTDYQFLDEDKNAEYKDEVYSCGDCGESYNSLNELRYHVILHADKFQCPIFECGCQYDQLSRLSIHVLNKHINTKNFQCLHCSQSFSSYDDLQAHLKHNCKEKKFECFECGVYITIIHN